MKFTLESDVANMISLMLPMVYLEFARVTNTRIGTSRLNDSEKKRLENLFELFLNFWCVTSDGIRPV